MLGRACWADWDDVWCLMLLLALTDCEACCTMYLGAREVDLLLVGMSCCCTREFGVGANEIGNDDAELWSDPHLAWQCTFDRRELVGDVPCGSVSDEWVKSDIYVVPIRVVNILMGRTI